MGKHPQGVSTQIGLKEMKDKVQNAFFLATASMLSAFPMFLYQFRHLTGAIFSHQPSAERLFYLSLTQSFIVFELSYLCALVVFLYSESLQLPEFGGVGHFLTWLPMGLVLGLVFTPLSYFAVDREMIQLIPRAFPRHWPWALGNMLGGAVAQEVIARFGLLTIGIYLFRRLGFRGHPWPAIALVSLFGCAGSYIFLLKFDLAQKFLPSQIAAGLTMAFFLQWIFCEVYVRKGFLATSCIHFGLNMKLFVYALVLD
jgi:hypothetical protein